jgi:hypothetical protein
MTKRERKIVRKAMHWPVRDADSYRADAFLNLDYAAAYRRNGFIKEARRCLGNALIYGCLDTFPVA